VPADPDRRDLLALSAHVSSAIREKSGQGLLPTLSRDETSERFVRHSGELFETSRAIDKTGASKLQIANRDVMGVARRRSEARTRANSLLAALCAYASLYGRAIRRKERHSLI